MGHDRRALLFDIINASRDIREFAGGLDSSEYESNSLVKYAVERRFIVIGEALNRLKRSDPAVFETIPRASQIIGFRIFWFMVTRLFLTNWFGK